MRIAVWHNLPSGGGKRALWHHVKGLVERGHHVEVWSPGRIDLDYLSLSEFCDEHIVPIADDFAWKKRRGKFRQVIQGFSAAMHLRNMFIEHCRMCCREIENREFDVLFANASIIGAVSPVGKMLTIPSVLYLPEPSRYLYEAMPVLPWAALPDPANGRWWHPGYLSWAFEDYFELLPKRIAVRDERENAGGYTSILVNSAFSRESVLRAYGLEAEVCGLGVDVEKFRPSHEIRDRFVIGLGAVKYHKGIDRALSALGQIPGGIRPSLVWVGDSQNYAERERIECLANNLNVRLDVKIGISDDELLLLLNRASMMIYTSRLEPFGFAPLEACACETPVVAVAEGGVRETIIDGLNGVLVPSAEPRSLANAVVRLLNDSSYARKLGVAARKHVMETWSWKNGVARLEAYLSAATEASRL